MSGTVPPPPLGSQNPRTGATRPTPNSFTPPIPTPTITGKNMGAVVEALKQSVESLTGQRGDASNRAVLFRDLISYGLLDVKAAQSPVGSAPGYLPIAGGTITGNLTVKGTTALNVATATTPTTADNSINVATTAFVKAQGYGKVNWVPYTASGQAFQANNLTRDGAWTMVAKANTTDRPAPQPTGAETDLLPAWTPTTPNARASYSVYNEWTLNTAGWISQYGADVLPQNVGATHVIQLRINGVVQDSFTAVPNESGLYLHDITPIVVTSGAVVRVTLSVTMIPPNNQMYWMQQTGLFATAPIYTSLAQGSKDGAAAGTTAYGCHATLTPGTISPNWDVVAYGGAAAGGSGAQMLTLSGDVTGSGTTAIPTTLAASGVTAGTYQGLTIDAKGRVTAAVNMGYVTGGPYLPLTGGSVSGLITSTVAVGNAAFLAQNGWYESDCPAGRDAFYAPNGNLDLTHGNASIGGNITVTGQVTANGAVSTGLGIVILDRTSGYAQWQLYALNGIGNLWNNVTGNVLSFTTAGTMTPVAGIAGVTNGSNAAAGNIGEYHSVIQATPVGLSYGITQNPMNMTLGPGDWDVNGEVYFGNSVAFGTAQASISTNNALPSQPTDSSSLVATQGTSAMIFNAAFSTMRVSVSTNVTIYLNTYVTGSGGAPTMMGIIRARRVHP